MPSAELGDLGWSDAHHPFRPAVAQVAARYSLDDLSVAEPAIDEVLVSRSYAGTPA